MGGWGGGGGGSWGGGWGRGGPRKEVIEELHAVAMTGLYDRRTHLKKDGLSATPSSVNSAGPSVG